jgi:Saxitoxin biosynthesis operon protein SxtJ
MACSTNERAGCSGARETTLSYHLWGRFQAGPAFSMVQKGPEHRERSFGVSVGAVSVLAAALFWWRGSTQTGLLLGIVGGTLVVLGAVAPRLLYWPSVVWWKLVHVLGYVNARIILTILFTVLLVPIGLFWRLTGKDPLGRRRGGAGWSTYPARYRDPKHYSRMY